MENDNIKVTEMPLSNPQNDSLTAKILAVIGNVCNFVHQYEPGDEQPFAEWFELPALKDSKLDLVIVRGGWCGVEGAFMTPDGQHLVLLMYYAGDGSREAYSPTYVGTITEGGEEYEVMQCSETDVKLISPLPDVD